MSLGTILIIILILILLGVIPTWGHSRGWGYGPSGIVGTFSSWSSSWLCWVGSSLTQRTKLPVPQRLGTAEKLS
jgi:Protein of unknown function (DUF3309)